MNCIRTRLLALAALLTLLPLALLFGYSLNAQTMGSGGISLTPEADLDRNPARHAVPDSDERSPVIIPLPLGLVKFLVDPPEFDPEEPNFDLVKIVNLAFNPPLDLELIEPPNTEQSDVTVDLGLNNLRINLGRAGETIPEDEVNLGLSLAPVVLDLGLGGLFFDFGPFAYSTTESQLDNRLTNSLRNAEPFIPGNIYHLKSEGEAGAGLYFALGHARKVAGFGDGAGDPRDGLYLGVAGKLLMGLAYLQYDADIDFITGNPIFGPSNPMTTSMNGFTRTSAPGQDESGSTAFGAGLDLGLSLIRGPWELGGGVRDVVSTIGWKVHEEIHQYDELSNEFRVVGETEKKSHSAGLPRVGSLSLLYHGEGYSLGTAVRKEALGFTTHMGAEYELHPAVKVRGGFFTDTNNIPQVSGGMGFRAGWFGFDFALATNNYNISRERGLSLFTSFAIY